MRFCAFTAVGASRKMRCVLTYPTFSSAADAWVAGKTTDNATINVASFVFKLSLLT